MQIEFMTADYNYKTSCVWQCDFGVKHFYLLVFSYLISFLIAFALTFFNILEQRKKIIDKLTCIKRDIFWEEQIT